MFFLTLLLEKQFFFFRAGADKPYLQREMMDNEPGGWIRVLWWSAQDDTCMALPDGHDQLAPHIWQK